MCKRLSPLLLLAVIAAVGGCLLSVDGVQAAGPKPGLKLPPIYDTKADGAKQIAEALAIAKRDNKRVLLQFGANWCAWCHRLHDLFSTDPAIARKLLYEYVLVLIDVDEVNGKKHNEKTVKRYGNPLKRGVPALVVLDADGRQLTTQYTEPFEVGDHHDVGKVLVFLEKWQAKAVSAEKTLSAGLARAASESKLVFAYFTAPWCAWCKKLDAYLASDEIATAFGSAYVPTKLDVERMTGGEALAEKHGGKDGGLPFFVVLDAKGNKLADSKGEKGNVGFPVEPYEIAHFMKVIRQTGKKLTPQQVAVLERRLKDKPTVE